MNTLRRFTYSAGRDRPLEASAAWAAEHDFGAVEFNADLPPNSPDQWDDARVTAFRKLRAEHRLAAGIHTSSAVNNAEIVPVVGDGVAAYLRQNVELAARLGCGYVIVHGGYHFGDREQRREAARRRLERPPGSLGRAVGRCAVVRESQCRAGLGRNPLSAP